MPASGVWKYKYGTLTIPANAEQIATAAAAADPTETYNFVWDNQDP